MARTSARQKISAAPAPREKEDKDATSTGRAIEMLAALAADNTPVAVADLAQRLDIPRSTAYLIAREMLRLKLLDSRSRGKVELGRKVFDLFLAQQRQRELAAPDSASAQRGRTRAAVGRTFLWNPELTEMYDCREFRRTAPYRIGFSNASTSNPWRVALLHGIEWSAQRHAVRIERMLVSNAQDDPAQQNADIEQLAKQDIDILLVSCAQAQAIDAAAGKVFRSGIPVVAVDRRPASTAHFITHVTASDTSLARITAQWVVEKLVGHGQIILLGGTAGSSPAQRRVKAALEVFKQYPQIEILDTQFTQWRADIGQELMRKLIARHGNRIDAVWCDSGLQGVGSIRAFVEAGFPDGVIPLHTGGDVNEMFQLVCRHRVPLCSVDYPSSMGIKAFDTLFAVLDGRVIPRRIEVDSQIVVSRGHETASVIADRYVEDYVLWDRPGDLIMSNGLGADYDPATFQASYPA